MNKNGHDDDLIVEGFVQLDERYLERRPPHIKWGVKYQNWSDQEKIQYLQGLAQTMNHAASLVQGERDQLQELCELKEQQLYKLNEAIRQNNAMLQQEVTLMNQQRQDYNETIRALNAELTELKNAHNGCLGH